MDNLEEFVARAKLVVARYNVALEGLKNFEYCLIKSLNENGFNDSVYLRFNYDGRPFVVSIPGGRCLSSFERGDCKDGVEISEMVPNKIPARCLRTYRLHSKHLTDGYLKEVRILSACLENAVETRHYGSVPELVDKLSELFNDSVRSAIDQWDFVKEFSSAVKNQLEAFIHGNVQAAEQSLSRLAGLCDDILNENGANNGK